MQQTGSGRFVSTVYIRFAAAPGDLQRAPALEQLLTRPSTSHASTDWRQEAFDAIAPGLPVPAVAPVALYGSLGVVPGQWVCVASPLHLVAGMTSVTLSAGGLLKLAHEESVAWAASFNSVFGDSGMRMVTGRAGLLLCVGDRHLQVTTHDPRDVIGDDVFGFQPAGSDAARVRRLMSEIEMWLFDHALNRARSSQGNLPITALWLWGGGPLLSTLPATRGWTAGDDALFAAFGDKPAFPQECRGADAAGVLVCTDQPGSAGWSEMERLWLDPLAAALRSGRIDELKLSRSNRVIVVRKGLHWRAWRRPRPWWEAFGEPNSNL